MQKQEKCSHILSLHNKKYPIHHKGHLFLGGVNCLTSTNLAQCKITAILSIINESDYKRCKIKAKVQQNKIQQHKWIDLLDIQKQKIYPHLHQSHEFIKSVLKKHNLLVHCQMGKSRSSSLVIAFMMKQYEMGYYEALGFVRERRNIVKPNKGFQNQLKQFGKELLCKKFESSGSQQSDSQQSEKEEKQFDQMQEFQKQFAKFEIKEQQQNQKQQPNLASLYNDEE